MSFDLEAVHEALRGTMFAGKLRHFAEIDSTNTYAMRAGVEGAPHGSVYVADAQTAGRGRGAHQWASPAGSGLYVSALLRPAASPGDALLYSLAAGLAALGAVRDAAGLRADLRWPNDLLAGGRKLGGVLCEMQAEATRVRFLVIGVGINVSQEAFPPEFGATSLAMEGRPSARETLLVALLRALESEAASLDQPGGAADLLQRIEEASTWIRGKAVTVGEEQPFSGVAEGLDARGFLQVRTDAGELRTVLSGGVRERRS